MIRAIEPTVPGYPRLLAGLARPPARLWLTGEPPPERAVAVVGTRHPDPAGRALAARWAAELAGAGYAVVSGLAVGIDAAAHRAALEAGGRTWAVLGCGVDRPACPEDPSLGGDIVAAGGGLIAEVPPGTPASAQTLVARDRIQTGLSLACVVVQTDLRSGTMHTARFCLQQGRVLAVAVPPPGSGAASWAGNRALLDPRGSDPAVVHARGGLARELAGRRPLADLAIPADEALLPPLVTAVTAPGRETP